MSIGRPPRNDGDPTGATTTRCLDRHCGCQETDLPLPDLPKSQEYRLAGLRPSTSNCPTANVHP